MRVPEFRGFVRPAIFLIALAVRLAFVHEFSRPPVNDQLWNDAVGWNLALGNGFTSSQSEPRVPGVYRTPGYPVFLSLIYRLFGHSYDAVFVAQSLLDAGSAILIGLIAMQFISAQTATITAILYALYPYPAMFCGAVHQDILLVFCFLLFLLFLSRAIVAKRFSAPFIKGAVGRGLSETLSNPQLAPPFIRGENAQIIPWIIVGILIGLTAYVKANMILITGIAILCILFYYRAQRILKIVAVCGALALVLTPWIVRNYLLFGSFPPLAAGATGTNLKLLVMELNGGEQAVRKVGLARPKTEVSSLIEDGKNLIASEKREADRAIPELKKRWPEYSLLILRHIPRLWISKYSRWYSSEIALFGTILSWMVLVAGLVGMFLMHKEWRGMMPLYLAVIWITMMYAPYTVEARYTMPARPVMICFIAAALMKLFSRTRDHDRNTSDGI